MFNCLHLFKTKNKLESHKKICENKVFCGAVMPSENTKTMRFSQYRKYDDTLSIVYADLESLIKKIDGCRSNFELPITKIAEHISCGYSMSMI